MKEQIISLAFWLIDYNRISERSRNWRNWRENEKTDWWKDVMLLNEKTLAVAAPPVSPEEHLKNARYMEMIERNSGAPERDARWCTWKEDALNKCRSIAKAAFSR